jgi:hypothetical protein
MDAIALLFALQLADECAVMLVWNAFARFEITVSDGFRRPRSSRLM